MTAPIAHLLREHGLRVTPQRRAILSAFAEGEAGHLTADDVLQRARVELPELSRGTVYSALGELVVVGLLATVDGPGPQRYDRNLEPHHHFRCGACGALLDVQVAGLEALKPLEQGFEVERTQVLLEGRCPRCARTDGQPRSGVSLV
mgnify:CR=1 FL=1